MKKTILIIIIGLLFAGSVSAQFIPGAFWRLIGNALLPMNDTWELGSNTIRIAKGWFTDLDASGVFTLGGTVGSGGLDLNGEQLIIDEDGDTLFQATADDYLELDIGTASILLTTTGSNFDSGTFFIDNTNNRVGIGTTEPLNKLHVKDDIGLILEEASGIRSLRLKTPVGGAQAAIYTSGTGSGIDFFARDDRKVMSYGEAYGLVINEDSRSEMDFRIESDTDTHAFFLDATNGNVGIGDTSPDYALEILNTTTHQLALTYTDDTALTTFGVDSGGDLTIIPSGGDVFFPKLIGGTATTSDLYLQTTSGVGTTGADMHFLVGNNGGTEAMTILNSGNVGIGTTAPGAKLEVSGSGDQKIVVASTGGSYSPGIRLQRGTPDDDYVDWNIYTSSANLMIDTYRSARGTNNRFFIDYNSGNVGIGTTGPGAKLESYSSAATIQELMRLNNPDGSGAGMRIGFNQGATQYGKIDVIYSGGWQMRLGAGDTVSDTVTIKSGNVGIGDTSPDYALDILSTTTSQLNLAYTDGTAQTMFYTDSSGNLAITPTGGKVTINDILNLNPKATAPATCSIGEIYVDTSGAYCGCSATNTWENLGTTGSCL